MYDEAVCGTLCNTGAVIAVLSLTEKWTTTWAYDVTFVVLDCFDNCALE